MEGSGGGSRALPPAPGRQLIMPPHPPPPTHSPTLTGAGVLSPGLSGRASLLPSSPTQRTITLGAPSSTLLGATLSEAYDRPHPAANSRRSRLSSDS